MVPKVIFLFHSAHAAENKFIMVYARCRTASTLRSVTSMTYDLPTALMYPQVTQIMTRNTNHDHSLYDE